MRRKICTGPAPSIVAASTSDGGRSRIELNIMKTAKGSPKIVCEIQTVQ